MVQAVGQRTVHELVVGRCTVYQASKLLPAHPRRILLDDLMLYLAQMRTALIPVPGQETPLPAPLHLQDVQITSGGDISLGDNKLVTASVGTGNFTCAFILTGLGSSSQVRIFVSAEAGTQTLKVVDEVSAIELFTYTNSGTATVKGMLEFVYGGTAWVPAGPNVMFESSAEPPSGLFAFWTLLSDGVDSVGGYNVDGTITYSALGAAFDGINYLQNDTLVMPTSWTLTGWINPTILPSVQLVSGKYSSGPANTYQLATVDDTLVAVFRKSGEEEEDVNVTSGNVLTISTEVFFAMSFNSSTGFGRLIINDTTAGSVDVGGDLGADTGDYFTLGSNSSGSVPFTGTMRYVRLYSGELSEVAVAALYNAGTPN